MKYRRHVSKHRSARKFKRDIKHTKAANVKAMPMRGGIRL